KKFIFSLATAFSMLYNAPRGGGEASPINLQFQTLMKKTITTLIALAGAAFAEAQTFTLADNTAVLIPNSGIPTDLAECTGLLLSKDGWKSGLLYGGPQGAASNTIDNWDTNEKVNVTSTTFNIYGRQGIGGEVMLSACEITGTPVSSAITLSIASGNISGSVTYALSFGIVAKSSDGNNGYTYTVVAQGSDSLTLSSTATTPVSKDFNVSVPSTFVEREGTTYYSIFRIYGEGPSGQGAKYNTVTISGWTATSVSVPEPATATLSLLALAGLAARRRRK
ncbi:MAG: PEP-CTERM sorting domain-containing protein, partial [Akkermansia sp.]